MPDQNPGILFIFLLILYFFKPFGAQSQPMEEIYLYDSTTHIEEKLAKETKVYDENSQITHIGKVQVPRLLVYRPSSPCGTGIIVCPGGGYRRYNVQNTEYIADRLTKVGITVFVLLSRLPDEKPMPERSIRSLQDVQAAFRLIRSRATEFGLSKNNIGLWGSSAGGHLAAMAATHFTTSYSKTEAAEGLRPDFLILAWPVISFRSNLVHKGSMHRLLGESPTEEQISYFSPDEAVDADTPPAFLVHAGDDPAVPAGNSIQFYEALQRNNVPAELHIYQSGGHGFGIAPNVPYSWIEQLKNWLAHRNLIE